jgi:hypothetical protein
MPRNVKHLLIAVVITAVAAVGAAVAPRPAAAGDDRPIADFFGQYRGKSISEAGDELSPRDLDVQIGKWQNDGFTLHWTTVIRRADKPKHQSYTINFRSSNRSSIYGSAMHRDQFNNTVPLDPLKGEPYVWARILDATLTVYALLITDDGGYEMQVYDRTLTPSGMSLRFSRLRDGQQLRLITGELERVGK